ncbi:MAG: hypothetical protein ABI398_10250 [Devosia sp.]
MIKTSLFALGGVVALALVLPQQVSLIQNALAASTAPFSSSSLPPPPTSSTPPTSSEPPGGGGGNGPDLPDVPKDEQITKMSDTCNAALGELIKIPEKLVVAFANQSGVSVVPVCNNGVGREARIDATQALPLQNAIAKNSALLGPLQGRGFNADDVVGVVLIDGVATLYVHKNA